MPDMKSRPISVLILDDHALFRESVARLLEADPGVVVAGHCGTIDEALAVMNAHQIDIVLLDFDLGHRNGADFLAQATRQGFSGKVLVVTAGVEREEAATLIRQGTSGIFMKHDSAAKLVEAIRDVMAGKVWFDAKLLQDTVDIAPQADVDRQTMPFTARERSVLTFVFEGLANKEIAGRIGVSESSVKATLQQLFTKTGVRTRSQLVRIVLEQYRDQL